MSRKELEARITEPEGFRPFRLRCGSEVWQGPADRRSTRRQGGIRGFSPEYLKLLLASALVAGSLFINNPTATAFAATPYTEQVGAANPLNGIDVGSNAAPAFVDIDFDGDLDLFVGAFDGQIRAFRNDDIDGNVGGTDTTLGNPAFTPVTGPSPWPNGNPFDGIVITGGYSAPAFVDIDGDGDPDCFIGRNGGYISLYRNTDDADSVPGNDPAFFLDTGGPAMPGFDSGSSGYSQSVPSFADLDGDGDFDAFVGANGYQYITFGSYGYYGIMKFREGQSGTFITPAGNPLGILDGGPREYLAPHLVDFDGDGDADAVIGGADGRVQFFENTSPSLPTALANVAFAERTGLGNPFGGIDVGTSSKPAVVDIDGDGEPELFVGDEPGRIRFFKKVMTAANLDSPALPTDPASRMVTLDDIFNRFSAGAQVVPAGPFVEPTAGPGPAGRTIDEVMLIAPQADSTGAAPAHVRAGKTFWALRPDGTWGPMTGTLP